MTNSEILLATIKLAEEANEAIKEREEEGCADYRELQNIRQNWFPDIVVQGFNLLTPEEETAYHADEELEEAVFEIGDCLYKEEEDSPGFICLTDGLDGVFEEEFLFDLSEAEAWENLKKEIESWRDNAIDHYDEVNEE